ncbi:ABC transporter permease [Rudaeicoccus suwonensis]|uniref:ABC-2 type transport system permease protein n=1 Tax=Rudaeicoccus suwonensis TaxID=657409 RepID=A0A561E9U1_9MICO|nr:ABC transporter permease [Rudaeicoccus suwonensis]TWE12379.1 ABC-2 type transport system permease protein [Rudaeicoccus suwonensis]
MSIEGAAIHPLDTPINLDRKVPPRGGFNGELLLIELRRVLRNRRTMIFTVALPVIFFVAFGLPQKGNLTGSINARAYEMISFAIYGAFAASTAIGASVSVERAQGWSRQLRLTPLSGAAYIAVKVIAAMAGAALPVIIVFAIGMGSGAKLGTGALIASLLLTWICGSVLASLGLFVGYVVPSENAMQILGPALSILAFGGGIFYPLAVMSHTMQQVASFTPLWGLSQIARYPLLGGSFDVMWMVSGVAWVAAFTLGAIWRFRSDTKRV